MKEETVESIMQDAHIEAYLFLEWLMEQDSNLKLTAFEWIKKCPKEVLEK